MTNRLRRMQTGVAALLVVSLFGMPQVASARDNCNRQTNQYRGSTYNRSAYSDRSYSGYRNNTYRNDRYATNTYRDNAYYAGDYGDYGDTRSAGKSAAIIGGGAAAGAAVGAMSGGLKGAAIGAAVGGVGGLIYDRATRNNGNRW
jgi:hypothetical protein